VYLTFPLNGTPRNVPVSVRFMRLLCGVPETLDWLPSLRAFDES